jgi:N-acetylmuramoyl-L-alanine amidase
MEVLSGRKDMKTIIIDIGHGMSNRTPGKFDPGAVSSGIREADIALDWGNCLRGILIKMGHRVVRTRVDHADPAPVRERANIARQYKGQIMLSLHCNAANGQANGTETFYRGIFNKPAAERITKAVCDALGTRYRGAKNESQSQHSRLAVMDFQPCFLLEIGFIDHAGDRAAMLDPALREKACRVIAGILLDALK